MDYHGKFFWVTGASIIAIALGLYIGSQKGSLTGEPQRTLFFGGLILGCINVVLAAIFDKKDD